MKNSTPEKRATELQKAIGEGYETYESYLVETVNSFVEENNVYDVMRSLRKMRAQWSGIEPMDNKSNRNGMLQAIDSIESLLIDISEGRARLTDLLCKSHAEQLA